MGAARARGWAGTQARAACRLPAWGGLRAFLTGWRQRCLRLCRRASAGARQLAGPLADTCPALPHRRPAPHCCPRSWEKDGAPVTSVVFERGSPVPSAKMLTFYRAQPFSIAAEYTPDSDIPSTADRSIGAPPACLL